MSLQSKLISKKFQRKIAQKFDKYLGKKPNYILGQKTKQQQEQNISWISGLEHRYHKIRPRLRPKELKDMSHFREGDHVIITEGEYMGKSGRILSKFPMKNELYIGGFNMYREKIEQEHQIFYPKAEKEPKRQVGVYTDKGHFKCTDVSHVEHQLAIITLSSRAYYSPINASNKEPNSQKILMKILEQDLFRILNLCSSCSRLEVLKCLKPNQFLIRQYPEDPKCLSNHQNVRALLDLVENEYVSWNESELLMDGNEIGVEETEQQETEGRVVDEKEDSKVDEGEENLEPKLAKEKSKKIKILKQQLGKIDDSDDILIKSIDYACEDGSQKIPLSVIDTKPIVQNRQRKVQYVRVPFDMFKFVHGESVVLVEYDQEAMLALKAVTGNRRKGLKFSVKDWSQFVKFKKAVVLDSFLNFVKIRFINENKNSSNESNHNGENTEGLLNEDIRTVSFKQLRRCNFKTGKIINQKIPTYRQRVIKLHNDSEDSKDASTENKGKTLTEQVGYDQLPFDEYSNETFNSSIKINKDFYDLAFRLNEYIEVNQTLDTKPKEALKRTYFNELSPYKIHPFYAHCALKSAYNSNFDDNESNDHS